MTQGNHEGHQTDAVEVSIRGKAVKVPSLCVDDKLIVITGKLLRIASVKGEGWLETDTVGDPAALVSKLKKAKAKADLFTFAQNIPESDPKYKYYLEWENYAVAHTCDFDKWWNQLPQESRKNVRRAGRRGVVVRKANFDDELINGIVSIYNETPIRQGRRFWHYGKNFDTVKKDNSTYLDRSDFVGAYFNDELIGFMKVVYMGELASIMQILSINHHSDKRPMNALIAKAVECCQEKGTRYLIYGNYIYSGNTASELVEFKRRNGFTKILIPRYYIPLNARGELMLKLGIHHGFKAIIPERILEGLRNLRSKWYAIALRRVNVKDSRKNSTVNCIEKGVADNSAV